MALILALGALALPVHGEASEWAQYLLLGALTPVVALVLARASVPLAVRRGVAALGAAGMLAYVGWSGRWVSVPLGVAQVLLTAALARGSLRAADVIVAVAAWSAAGALGRTAEVRFVPLAEYLTRWDRASIVWTSAAFLWVVGSMALRGRLLARPRPAWRMAVTVCALAALAIESLRVDHLFDTLSFHHWGVFIAPAEAVRQGGWLLWDVPATYGPLSTLAIAAVPTASVWDGFFLLNALACLVSGALLFLLLRERVDPVLAAVLSLAAVLFLPGARLYVWGGGVLTTPNGGPFRFVWCQALLVLAARRPQRPGTWVVGTLLWLVGCMWSSESAVYCSLTWLPAYALLVHGMVSRQRLRWLALPPLLVAGTLVTTWMYYDIRLGHGPDWYAFVEASLGVSGGAEALAIEPWGPVAVLVLALWVVVTGATAVLRRETDPAAIAPLCAAFGAVWSTASYFVGRSHGVIVTDLLPTVCLAGLVVLRELRPPEAGPVRTAMTALLAAMLLLAIHEPSAWMPRRPLAQRYALGVDALRPRMAPDQLELMRRAGIAPGSPVILYDLTLLPAWPPEGGPTPPDTIWLPVTPLPEIVPVREDRRQLYMARFAARTHAGGWLIENTVNPVPPEAGGPWFSSALTLTHRPTAQVEVGRWRATWYEFVGG